MSDSTPLVAIDGEPSEISAPRLRVLIHKADSAIFHIKVQKTDVTKDDFHVLSYDYLPVKFNLPSTSDEIEQFPVGVNGSAATIDEAFCKKYAVDFSAICGLIEQMEGYGQNFSFADDNKGCKTVLARMRNDVRTEKKIFNEAMPLAIAASDVMLESARRPIRYAG